MEIDRIDRELLTSLGENCRASKAELAATGTLKKAVVTPIRTLTEFWPAERYHQNYYDKNPLRYRYYRNGCGRDKQVKALWGKEAWAAK